MRLPGSPVTYQGQQKTVSTPTIDPNGLIDGIRSASDSFTQALAIKDDYKTQLNMAETQYATLQLADWSNEFFNNMNNPEQLEKFFSNTPMAEVLESVDYDLLATDSSYAQTIYRKAVDASANNITDEVARGSYITNQYLNFEKVEPAYKASVDTTNQLKAKTANLQVAERLFEDEPLSVVFAHLDSMYAQGNFGTGPEAYQALMAATENYGGRSQAMFIKNKIKAEFEPVNENGQRIMRPYTETEAKMHMNSIMEWSEVDEATGERRSYLSQEQINTIKESEMQKYILLGDAYREKVKDVDKAWFSARWSDADRVMYSDEVPEGMRVEEATNMLSSLSYMVGQDRGSFNTGDDLLPSVSIGAPDDTKMKSLTDKLASFIKNGGKDVDAPGYNDMGYDILSDTRLSPGEKLDTFRQVVAPNLSKSSRDYFEKALMNQQKEIYDSLMKKSIGYLEEVGGTDRDRRLLSQQIVDYIDTSLTVDSRLDLNAGAMQIAQDFVIERGYIDKALRDYQEGGLHFTTSVVNARRTENELSSFKFNEADAGYMLSLTDKGAFMGRATHMQYADLLTPMAAHVEMQFKDAINQQLLPLNKEDYILDVNGDVATTMTLDISGKPIIAVQRVGVESNLNGFQKIEVYRPEVTKAEYVVTGGYDLSGMSQMKNRNAFEFVKDDIYPEYYLGWTDQNGNPFNPEVKDGQTVDYANLERRVFYAEGTTAPLYISQQFLREEGEGEEAKRYIEEQRSVVLNILSVTDIEKLKAMQ